MKKAFLFLCTAILFVFFSVSAAAYEKGDIDKDGRISSDDARMVLRYSVGLEAADGEVLYRCDADNDGRVGASDARQVLRFAVGLSNNVSLLSDKGFSAYKNSITDLSLMYTYEDMLSDLAILKDCMPTRFSYWSMGVTADGREIICCRLGSGFGKNQIVVDAGTHGSEYLNPPAVISAIEYYLRSYDTPVFNGKTVRQVLVDTDIYFFPMLNPDGTAISQRGLSGLRSAALMENVQSIYNKNYASGSTNQSFTTYLKEWTANARGVDINRNFMCEKDGKPYYAESPVPANGHFAGEYMFSEPESQAYKKIIESLENIVAVLSIHSQGKLIYWDCQQSYTGKAQAQALAQLVSRYTGYYLDMSDSFVGATADWTMIEKGIPSVTVETGRGRNPLDISQQREIAGQIRDIFLAAADYYS